MDAKIEVIELPKMDLAYVSSTGTHNLSKGYETLIQWAAPNGLMNDETKMVTIYHDSFRDTEATKVRMSACILLNQPIEAGGEVRTTSLESGKHIVGKFELQMHEFGNAWSDLFVWMNENGYKKANKDPFGVYYNDHKKHPEKKAIVDLCIPVESK
jgi:AraC family transcriptional regulator